MVGPNIATDGPGVLPRARVEPREIRKLGLLWVHARVEERDQYIVPLAASPGTGDPMRGAAIAVPECIPSVSVPQWVRVRGRFQAR